MTPRAILKPIGLWPIRNDRDTKLVRVLNTSDVLIGETRWIRGHASGDEQIVKNVFKRLHSNS